MERYWLNTSFWDEPYSHWIEPVRRQFSYYDRGQVDIKNVLDVATKQLQHTSMGDGKRVYAGVKVELLPHNFREICAWLEAGSGRVWQYNRSPNKRGLYEGDLKSCIEVEGKLFSEKVPAQCMIICIFCDGLLKILEVPSRLRVGFVPINGVYFHHNELQYYDKSDEDWPLVDPTSIQPKKEGKKELGEFLYSFQTVEKIKNVENSPSDFNYPGSSEIRDLNGFYVLNRALADDFFALKNESIVPWKIEYLRNGENIKNDEDTFWELEKDLHDVLVEKPDQKEIRKIDKDVIDYRLKL